MFLPIVAYGDPVLKEVGEEVSPDYPSLKQLIENMYETMYTSHGVGLAAHQVGLAIRLFIVDCSPFKEEEPYLEDFKKTFINPEIIEQEGKEWFFPLARFGGRSVRGAFRKHCRNCAAFTRYQILVTYS